MARIARPLLRGVLCAALLVQVALIARADRPVVELEIRNHLFHPSELVVPANVKVKLIVYNRDPTPEEFESYELNREKVIMGGQKAVIFIGPLAPGEYPFFGEFNPKTAQGKVIAQ
ncbi:cupredoxin domain-containing protein [Microbulbifer magnicolonia]|uniref:cupredoxin domain-containing protein n=1 Tax=Microbulbifer magnicolonia TaxID=3109744 RepID=UPI002B41281C|nr:cupredoxin domain-containing protein [Microbulbifer sp. GG15]